VTDATFGFHGQGRTEVTAPSELTSVDDYLDFILARVLRPAPIELSTAESLGLTLAEDIIAEDPVPSFANSAMDGYALVAGDVIAASGTDPIGLRVTGEVAAGAAELPVVRSGVAVRIMTGAPVPPGADAIVPVELTTEEEGVVWVHKHARVGDHIRPVGNDVQPGQRLLGAGRRLGPADIGLLAAVGAVRVLVHPSPRVVVMSTGDELVGLGVVPRPGQIRDANGPMLAALVRQAGGVPFLSGAVPDDRRAMMEAIDANLGHADLFVLTGGVSAGTRDHVRDVLAALGEVHPFKVAMKPGMPQVFGIVEGVPVLALPGNPVSAFVSFEVFVRPVLRHLQGRRDRGRPVVRAVLAGELRSPAHKRSYARVKLRREEKRWIATPTSGQGSHQLTGLVVADGLAEIPAHITQVDQGDPVLVHLLVDL